jgi:hypothetical protein
MIDTAKSPDAERAIEQFQQNLRRFWKSKVKKHFSLRESMYGLDVKMNHRIAIVGKTLGTSPRLQNALTVNWLPQTGHITIRPATIYVKSLKMGGKMNLIEILTRGTGSSPKAYRVYIKKGGEYVLFDKRISKGTRGPQSNQQWINWMNEFIPYVDAQLEHLADRLEVAVAEEF